MTEASSFTLHLIRHGIPVSVEVVDAAGRTVHEHQGEPAEIA